MASLKSVMNDLECVLQKKAEAALTDGNVLGGNREATSGGDKAAPSSVMDANGKDQEHPQVEQTDDWTKSVDYQTAKKPGDDSVVADNAPADPPEKIAAIARSLMADFGNMGKSAFSQGAEAADKTIQHLVQVGLSKSSETLCEEHKYEEKKDEDESKDEDSSEEESMDYEKMSSDQKQRYQMFKQAGYQCAEEYLAGLQALEIDRMQKEAQVKHMMHAQAQYNAGVQNLSAQYASKGNQGNAEMQKQAAAIRAQQIAQHNQAVAHQKQASAVEAQKQIGRNLAETTILKEAQAQALRNRYPFV